MAVRPSRSSRLLVCRRAWVLLPQLDHGALRGVELAFFGHGLCTLLFPGFSCLPALQASEEQANRSREEAAHDAQGRVANVERYEVVLSPQQASPATERAAQTVQEGVATTGQTVGGLLGAATGAVTGVTAGTVGAAAEGTERAVEAVAFPLEGYDEMNVDEISKRLGDLSVEELQLVRDYEELNKRRESLLERMDRKIRSA